MAGGWLVPGLVDAHTHPGAAAPGHALDEQLLRKDLRKHVASGMTMIRSPGLAEGAPTDAVVYENDPRADLGQLDHPRAVILRGQLRHRRRAARTATALPR